MTSEAYITRQQYSEKPAKSEPLYLSMMIGSGSFMYAVSTNQFKNVVELVHVEITRLANSTFDITEKISYLVNNYLLHQRKFEKVNICFLNGEFTLVPEAFAADVDVKPLLKFTTGVEEVKRSLQHHLKNIHFCFTVEPELLNYLERLFPQASLRHSGGVSIDLLFGQHSLRSTDLYLAMHDGSIELAGKAGNELLFYNVFRFESNEDILYYLLFMMEQFNLDPLKTKLSLAGERAVSDELIKSIKRYIKQVSFCVADGSINLNGSLADVPKHYYFTLLNQHLCAL